jgi:hypothetical protein
MKYMKTLYGVSLIAALAITYGADAQSVAKETTTTTTTHSSGTVSEFSPGAIVIQSETATSPIPYTATETTTYVDEDGNAVARETVTSGVPVTVFYSKSGNDLVASKVVVKRSTKTETGPMGSTIEEKKTTITTP